MTIDRAPSLLALTTLIVGSVGCQSAQADTPIPEPEHTAPLAAVAGRDSVLFAGGCFWGVEAVFERVRGVLSATSGYAGGDVDNPSYGLVSTGTTGHAETVKVVFDPSVVSYTDLLRVFFAVAHNPTELNYQGPDHGTQYRSAIFYASPAQKVLTTQYIAQLTKAGTFGKPIVTEVRPWQPFHVAESYHQGYYDQHPDQYYIVVNDKPKVQALESEFPGLYRAK